MEDPLRKKLNRRVRKTLIQAGKKIGKLSEADKKTPSQKRSEAAKKKDARRAGVKHITTHYPCDCWKCPREPCGGTLEQCDQKSMVHRCKKCGAAVRHRIQEGDPWEYCPVCIVQSAGAR